VVKDPFRKTYGPTHYILVVQVFDCAHKMFALRDGVPV
jgi:hypothetical protein